MLTETQEEARFTSSGRRLEPRGEIGMTSHVHVIKMVLSASKAAEGTAYYRNSLKQPQEPAVGKKGNSCVDDPKHEG